MRRANSLLAATGAALSMALMGPVAAQAGRGGGGGGGGFGNAEMPPQLRLDLDWGGGSARNFVELVFEQTQEAGSPANIVVMPGVEHVQLPELHLREVSVGTALALLENREVVIDTARIILDVDYVHRDTGEPVWLVQADSKSFVTQTAKSTAVWSLERLLSAGLSADAILTAVETAVEMNDGQPGATPVDLRFHEDTALLIARSDHHQNTVIDEVLARLRDDSERRIEEQQFLKQNEISVMRNRLQEVHQERTSLVEEVETLRVRLESTVLEMERLRSEIAQLNAHLLEREMEVNRLQMQIVEMHQNRGGGGGGGGGVRGGGGGGGN
ncbi:MAG: hypothetical protein ACF8PN_11425 [Phycisphaerales bacterium]